MRFRVEGSVSRVQKLGFRVKGLRLGVKVKIGRAGVRVQGKVYRYQGLRIRGKA